MSKSITGSRGEEQLKDYRSTVIAIDRLLEEVKNSYALITGS